MKIVQIWLIAKSVLIEAIRRKEIYVIALLSMLLIGSVMCIDFFNLKGLTKFYREIALKIMSVATVLTVVVLSARQLPREFKNRTIYPLLAKPVSRLTFMLGKLSGVMLAALFCFGIFMTIYVAGALYLGGKIPVKIFAEYIYLQIIMMLILSCLCFWLSLLMNLDAAITLGMLLFFLASTMMSVTDLLYSFSGFIGQKVILISIWVIPQLPLFDLSEKAVHASGWEPLGAKTMLILTAYGLSYAVVFFTLGMLWFRRKPL